MTLKNVRLTRWVAAAAFATAALLTSQSAQAAGTAAGTTVTNTVTVDFQVSGVGQTPVTANASFLVDDKVDLTVTNNSNATVVPGSTNQVTAFTLQNTGNATHGYSLAASTSSVFTMNNIRIYKDNNSDGNLDGGDTLYSLGTNVGDLAANATMRLLIVADTPAGAVNGNSATYNLIATTLNAGTTTVTVEDNTADAANTVQVVFGDGAGTADSAEDGKHSAAGTYTVATATISVTKTSAVVWDPYNLAVNPKRIPGARVEYTITVTNSGAVNATGVTVRDTVPANTTYYAGSILLNGASQTDLGDADASDFGVTNANAVTSAVGAVAPAGSATVKFTVTIN